MPNLDSCYELLGLRRGASQAEVRRAFQRLALQLHSNPAGAHTTARFQEIAEAYDRLKAAAPDLDSAVSPSPSPRWLWRLGGHLKSALACGGVRLLEDGTVELRLEEDEALTGGVAPLSFETEIVCRRCTAAPGVGCKRCADTGREHELVSFWLNIPARVADGTVLHPSVAPLKLVKPIAFVVRVPAPL
jgi:molecular chaperone DnaJ